MKLTAAIRGRVADADWRYIATHIGWGVAVAAASGWAAYTAYWRGAATGFVIACVVAAFGLTQMADALAEFVAPSEASERDREAREEQTYAELADQMDRVDALSDALLDVVNTEDLAEAHRIAGAAIQALSAELQRLAEPASEVA